MEGHREPSSTVPPQHKPGGGSLHAKTRKETALGAPLTTQEIAGLAEQMWGDNHPGKRLITPLTQAADSLIDYLQNPEGRFMIGIDSVDRLTRGFSRGELVYVIGRSHSGKTQVLLNALVNPVNRHKRVIIFTPDEPAELVLTKLVSLARDINAEDLERLVRTNHQPTLNMIRDVAANDFQNLFVVDGSMSFDQMSRAMEEAEQIWGGEAELVIIDFLEQLWGTDGDDGVESKSRSLKRWTKQHNVPVVCIHQSSRSSKTRGKAAGMEGMRYGGENDAIMVIEVYRKEENEDLPEDERQQWRNIVTVNVAKNKRPPGYKGEADIAMDPHTGKLMPQINIEF